MFNSFMQRVHNEIRKQYHGYASQFITKHSYKGRNEQVEYRVEVDINSFGLKLICTTVQVNDGVVTVSVYIETGVYAIVGNQVFDVGRSLMEAAEMERYVSEYISLQNEVKQDGVIFYKS